MNAACGRRRRVLGEHLHEVPVATIGLTARLRAVGGVRRTGGGVSCPRRAPFLGRDAAGQANLCRHTADV